MNEWMNQIWRNYSIGRNRCSAYWIELNSRFKVFYTNDRRLSYPVLLVSFLNVWFTRRLRLNLTCQWLNGKHTLQDLDGCIHSAVSQGFWCLLIDWVESSRVSWVVEGGQVTSQSGCKISVSLPIFKPYRYLPSSFLPWNKAPNNTNPLNLKKGYLL